MPQIGAIGVAGVPSLTSLTRGKLLSRSEVFKIKLIIKHKVWKCPCGFQEEKRENGPECILDPQM